jgi:exopolyphosphatase/guanosine-5'-triphosphate,3'-diphosphate pyrophosphatase
MKIAPTSQTATQTTATHAATQTTTHERRGPAAKERALGAPVSASPAEARRLLDNAPSRQPVAEVPVGQRAGRTAGLHALREGVRKDVFASIDLGSSSGKLLVMQRAAAGWRTLVDLKIGCALGKGVDNGGAIPAANMDRALDAVRTFVAVAAEHGVAVTDIPMITTAVVRNASNGAAFVARVAAEAGLSARVLSGDEEADLGFRGALGALLQTPGRYACLDLGGGSFQLAAGTHEGIEPGGSGSTQLGSNHILDEMIHPHVPPSGPDEGRIPAALFAQLDAAIDARGPMPIDPQKLAGRTLVATGGVSKFLRIHLGKDVVTRAEIDGLRRQLGAMSVPERAAFVQQGRTDEQKEALGIGTSPGAADYGRKLPASMSLLLHILDGIGVDEVRVSSTDARHALVFGAAAKAGG